MGSKPSHDDVIKWKHFRRNWPFVRGIHRSPVNSPHKDQWRGALMFSLSCVWINYWANNREAGDLRRYRAHYNVIVMSKHKADSIVNVETTICIKRTKWRHNNQANFLRERVKWLAIRCLLCFWRVHHLIARTQCDIMLYSMYGGNIIGLPEGCNYLEYAGDMIWMWASLYRYFDLARK